MLCKSNDWFQYETQHGAQMGYTSMWLYYNFTILCGASKGFMKKKDTNKCENKNLS